MLTISNLSFSYSRKSELIKGLDLQVKPGTVTGLLGKNGVGKTTLLYLICGLLKPQSGEIDFNGMVPFRRGTQFLSEVYMVPEEFRLPNIPLSEYVAANAPFYPAFDRDKMIRLLSIFELDADLHLGRLSMGQRKKAILAFGLACNTPLLILDEPTNGLDISSKRSFRQAISECLDSERSIIISTHQVFDIEKIIDNVVIMDRTGVLLNESIESVMGRLQFCFTTDRDRASHALISLPVPGGYNIAEPLLDSEDETEVNLETLFELTQQSHNR